MNLTNYMSVSDNCFNWCKQQYFNHQSNLTIQGMALPALAIICLFIAGVFLKFDKIIMKNTGISDEKLTKLYIGLNDLAFLLLLGFFVWFIFYS